MDFDGDGTPERIEHFGYDEKNNVIRKERDADGNGTSNDIVFFSYTATRDLSSMKQDSDGDGEIDLSIETQLDSNGNPITAKVFQKYKDGVSYKNGTATYDNFLKCPRLGEGLAHKLVVKIPEKGLWEFSISGSSFKKYMALSAVDFCSKELFYVENDKTEGTQTTKVELGAGDYNLSIGGQEDIDIGQYLLSIKKIE